MPLDGTFPGSRCRFLGLDHPVNKSLGKPAWEDVFATESRAISWKSLDRPCAGSRYRFLWMIEEG